MIPNIEINKNNDTFSKKMKSKNFIKDVNKNFKEIKISPKYLFSRIDMSKIKKLRNILIEFDNDNLSKKYFYFKRISIYMRWLRFLKKIIYQLHMMI